jgi:hypothetical protein
MIRLLTDPIFLDRIPDPDPFEKLDLISHSNPRPFSGSPIRSDPTYRSIWLLRDQKSLTKKVFPFFLLNLFDKKRVTFKSTKSIGSKIGIGIGLKLELQIKSNLIIQNPKRIGSVALQRIAIPIIPGKCEIKMRSRSDPQNNVIFRIAPIHDPIRQKPGYDI